MSHPHLMTCPNCSAPLNPRPGEGFVTCGYCGWVSRLAPPEPPPAPIYQSPQLGYQPIPYPTPRPRSPLVYLVVAAVVAGGGLLVAVLPVLFGSSWTALVKEWYSPACLVDANGDGALDVAGMVAAPGSERWAISLVDGATGRILWSGDSFTPYARLVCLSPRFFGVDDPKFRLHLHPARSPKQSVDVALRDRIAEVGMGDNCIALKLANDQSMAISFTGSALDSCPARLLKDQGLGGKFYGRDQWTERGNDASLYKLEPQPRGTPFLVASKSKDDRELWRKQLPFVTGSDSYGLALTPTTEVIWGAVPDDTNYGAIIGLDLQSGAQRFAVPQSSNWSGRMMQNMLFNGRYVIVSWGCGLHAYDPTSGKRAWHLGGR